MGVSMCVSVQVWMLRVPGGSILSYLLFLVDVLVVLIQFSSDCVFFILSANAQPLRHPRPRRPQSTV